MVRMLVLMDVLVGNPKTADPDAINYMGHLIHDSCTTICVSYKSNCIILSLFLKVSIFDVVQNNALSL